MYSLDMSPEVGLPVVLATCLLAVLDVASVHRSPPFLMLLPFVATKVFRGAETSTAGAAGVGFVMRPLVAR
jgi:hypothetical protein